MKMMRKIVSMAVSLVLAAGLCPAAALADGGGSAYAAGTARAGEAAALGEPGALGAQAAKAGYWVKTKDYRFRIPEYWRGKVQWRTTSSRYGNGPYSFQTNVYLKGHRDDSRYLLTSVIGGGFTGYGDGYTVVFHKKTKLQDYYPMYRSVTMLSKNVPYFIWAGYYDSYAGLYIPVKDQKQMLKLATFGKVSYAWAKRNANHGSPAYRAVKKYQAKNFKSTLRVLR